MGVVTSLVRESVESVAALDERRMFAFAWALEAVLEPEHWGFTKRNVRGHLSRNVISTWEGV